MGSAGMEAGASSALQSQLANQLHEGDDKKKAIIGKLIPLLGPAIDSLNTGNGIGGMTGADSMFTAMGFLSNQNIPGFNTLYSGDISFLGGKMEMFKLQGPEVEGEGAHDGPLSQEDYNDVMNGFYDAAMHSAEQGDVGHAMQFLDMAHHFQQYNPEDGGGGDGGDLRAFYAAARTSPADYYQSLAEGQNMHHHMPHAQGHQPARGASMDEGRSPPSVGMGGLSWGQGAGAAGPGR